MPLPIPSRAGSTLRLLLCAGLLAVAACGAQTDTSDAAGDPDDTATKAPAGAEPRGRVVSRSDVDGDGARDVVRYQVLRGDRVRITVVSGGDTGGDVDRAVLDTELWPGPGGQWFGAAELDGAAGVELLIGTAMGAHTPFHTVLTMRTDRLEVQRNPADGSPQWWTDAFFNGYVGWTRSEPAAGGVRVVRREVFRVGDSDRWRGEARSFRWDGTRWVADGSRDLRVRGEQRAAAIGGWHVPGLPRWPDLNG